MLTVHTQTEATRGSVQHTFFFSCNSFSSSVSSGSGAGTLDADADGADPDPEPDVEDEVEGELDFGAESSDVEGISIPKSSGVCAERIVAFAVEDSIQWSRKTTIQHERIQWELSGNPMSASKNYLERGTKKCHKGLQNPLVVHVSEENLFENNIATYIVICTHIQACTEQMR
mgnify:CR=1 FL=1